jgi:hypothetical protein
VFARRVCTGNVVATKDSYRNGAIAEQESTSEIEEGKVCQGYWRFSYLKKALKSLLN